ncbi:MAG: pimeloyl-ACP methyl ester esterase BioH [Thiobacillus sp.]
MKSSRPFLGLLHGWGMNARVFDALVDALSGACQVQAFELPGHGGRADVADNTLAGWASDLAGQLPAGATLLGWSLGGQVALRAALDHPQSVARLVLLASTPRFVSAADWPHGMDGAELDGFAASLRADCRATLLRFLSLQTRGVEDQKTLLQALRAALASTPAPTAASLDAGLELLRETDLRADLARVRQPALVVHGGLDTLSPAAAGAWLAARLPAARLLELPRAGHAPHLSHSGPVADAVRAFCHA